MSNQKHEYVFGLRKRAELFLKKKSAAAPNELSAEAMPLLIHELQVHQIELEMQNEELRSIQSELEKSRSKYADLYHFAPVGYFTFSNMGLIVEANLTGAGQLAVDLNCLINKPFFSYVAKDDRDIFYLHMKKVFHTGSRQTCELAIKNSRGAQFHAKLESIVSKELKGNDVLRTSLIDITDSRKLEHEKLRAQKMESIGILTGGIAHDFNNLLSAIRNNVYLLKLRADYDSNERSCIDTIERILDSAGDLTRQFLTFSKGGPSVKRTEYVYDLIRESAELVLRGSNSRCEYSMADNVRPVEVDWGQMNQALHNLILNADQSMPAGGTIQISADNFDHVSDSGLPLEEGRYVAIAIKDQGIGIAEEDLQKIYDPYFTTKDTGKGLGLSMVFSIINKHDGHISVESQTGVGTTFTIYLPASDKQVEKKVTAVDTVTGGEGKVLIMDDEEIIRESIAQLLTKKGYYIECAEDGDKAIELYMKAMGTSHPFDAVVLDLTIRGGMGGEETIGKLLAADPGVKAIVSSGYTSDPVMVNYREYGFSGVYTKCDRTEELQKTLRNVING